MARQTSKRSERLTSRHKQTNRQIFIQTNADIWTQTRVHRHIVTQTCGYKDR